MKNSIQNFLQEKANGQRSHGMFDYPIKVIDTKGQYRELFIQDAESTVKQNKKSSTHSLLLLAIEGREDSAILALRRTCKAPAGCVINWDEVHCAFDVTLQDEED